MTAVSDTERRRAVTAEEADVHSRARRFYCYTQRPGVTKRAKRRTNRRERRERAADARRRAWEEQGPPVPEDGEK